MRMIVYGTLKKYYSNPLDKNYGGTKLADVLVTGHEMYTNGAYPMVVPGEGTIQAELWDVPEDQVKRVDEYEGHPHLFKRTYIEEHDAEMYVYQGDEMHYYARLPSGFFPRLERNWYDNYQKKSSSSVSV